MSQTDPSRDADSAQQDQSSMPTTNEPILVDDSGPRKPASARDDPVTLALRFLSTATPATLGAIAVGLAATTYLILGKIGLILIGALAGAVLTLTWEAHNPEISRSLRREKGVDTILRILERPSIGRNDSARVLEDYHSNDVISFEGFQPETREALTALVEAIVRDYVKWWYTPLIPSDAAFPRSCQNTLTSFLVAVSSHLGRKRPADIFVDFLTNASSIVIVFLSELANAFADLQADSNMSAADAVYNYLASNPESPLANLLNQRQQASKLRMVSEDLLGFLERSAYDCDPARIFLREVWANLILETTLQTCSKAEWINGWIVYLLEAGEPDLNQAIDMGMKTGPESYFSDIDGNVGNIGLAKGNRSSFEIERAKKKEATAHRKKLSRAEEEMDEAMEEMRRINRMIAEEEERRAKEAAKEQGAKSTTAETPLPQSAGLAARSEGDRTDADAQVASNGQKSSPRDSIHSSGGEPVYTPGTPGSFKDVPSPTASPTAPSQFTNFDQIVPPAGPDADDSDNTPPQQPNALTLYNASITIYDDATSDKGRIRTKPTWDYMVQIEPAGGHHPGWMIMRRYSDFDTLHEILRRIAKISGAAAFLEQHGALPNWKLHTRESLRGELERYLREACWYQALAESEGMKKFLERNTNLTPSKAPLSFEAVGKGMLDVLSIAPKGAMAGSKVVVGGVTGVLGNIGLGPRKQTSSSMSEVNINTGATNNSNNRMSLSNPPRELPSPGLAKARDSMDSQQSSVISTQPGKIPPMDRHASLLSNSDGDFDTAKHAPGDRGERVTRSGRPSREHSRASSQAPRPSMSALDISKLPPPPSQMPDDYDSPIKEGRLSESQSWDPTSGSNRGSLPASLQPSQGPTPNRKQSTPANATSMPAKLSGRRDFGLISEQDTRMAVDVIFAVITQMYTLSSAWNIRRTLLSAAKSFLLRPGNPSLTSIQSLIQKSVLDANASDQGVAHQLRQLRANSLPTEAERAAWPAAMTAEESEKLREKARRLLIRDGLPAALTGVMGAGATAEAMGRIFDCLQVEEVARGLIFGVMLQAVRIVTH